MFKTNSYNYCKVFSLLILLLAFTNISRAQINALTENGKQVLLFNDGTWKYKTDSTSDKKNIASIIPINPGKFVKSSDLTFPVKSNTVNVEVFIDPDKWTFKPHPENVSVPEYSFENKSGDGYAMLITEKTEVDLNFMSKIALTNAQNAASDAKITMQEYRMVNNKKLLCLGMEATVQGIKVKYLGYYYSSKNGTVQLVAYSGEGTYPDLKKDLETFLSGLILID